LGVPPGWAESLFASQPDLEEVDFDGDPAWINAETAGQPAKPTPIGHAGRAEIGRAEPAMIRVAEPADTNELRLLPYFDSYLIACHPRAALFPGPAADRALNRGQAGNIPAVLIDGRVGGVWHQRRSGRKIELTVEPLARLSARHRQELQVQAVRLGQILDGTANLTVGKVDAGAHA
jgi:hypothetical protein